MLILSERVRPVVTLVAGVVGLSGLLAIVLNTGTTVSGDSVVMLSGARRIYECLEAGLVGACPVPQFGFTQYLFGFVLVPFLTPEVALKLLGAISMVSLFLVLGLIHRSAGRTDRAAAGWLVAALWMTPMVGYLSSSFSDPMIMAFAVTAMVAIIRGWPLWIAVLTLSLATASRESAILWVAPIALARRPAGHAPQPAR